MTDAQDMEGADDRWRYIPDQNYAISEKSIDVPESHMSKWYVLLLLLFSSSCFPLHSPRPHLVRNTEDRERRDTDDQLFFDDEHRNFEVESLGVTMCLVESRGTDLRLFKEGLGMWRKRRGLKVEQD